MIDEFAELIPSELKKLSGAVFYSGKNAFQGKKALYILGLNPGGSEVLQRDETIEWHTNNVLTKKHPNWSEYKDEIWRGNTPGLSGLQPRILHLLNKLNLSPYDVPSSNICFVRSTREKDISDKLSYYAELCWSFHEKVIMDLEIEVILCFGKRSGNFVRRKIHADSQIDQAVEKNNRKWESLVFKNAKGQFVIVATHPSIADWTSQDTDPSELVKKYVTLH